MIDKNGKTIHAGDIVEIKNAYFKTDNGFWFVTQDGTNKAYTGTGLTLRKIGKTGRISATKYKIAFWPLITFTNDRAKRFAARNWNDQNATIEITDQVKNDNVITFFEEQLYAAEQSIKNYSMRGYEADFYAPDLKNRDYLKKALERLSA